MRRGYCAATEPSSGDCSSSGLEGLQGSWPLAPHDSVENAARYCFSRCAGCARCRFVSLSVDNKDCSWFYECPQKLQTGVRGFATVRFRNATEHVAEYLARPSVQQRRRQRDLVERVSAELADDGAFFEMAARRPPRPSTGSFTLALGVMAYANAVEQRRWIRRTYRHRLSRAVSFTHRFVIGTRRQNASVLQRLTAEHAAAGDLALLPDARDGSKSFNAEKTQRWLLHAHAAFPRARYIGKADLDAFVSPSRVDVLLDQLARQRPNAAVLVGRLEWVSYIPRLARFCGCCGYSEQMSRAQQFDSGAADGGCAAGDIPAAARSEVVGPFVYPVGVFYALSRPLVARLLPSATRLATRLGDDRLVPCSGKWECGQYRRRNVIEDPRHLDRFERHEDLLLGHAISRIGEDVTYVQWGRTVFRDLDAANGPRDYAAIERKCLGELRPPVAEAELSTGTASGWGTPETVGPMSAVVHRAKGEAQWRRVWAMEAEWTRRVVLNGKPACVFPQATVVWRRNRTQSEEVELPWVS